MSNDITMHEKWYYLFNGQPVGSFSTEQLLDLYRSQVLYASTLISKKGTDSWQKFSEIFDVEVNPPPLPRNENVHTESKINPIDKMVQNPSDQKVSQYNEPQKSPSLANTLFENQTHTADHIPTVNSKVSSNAISAQEAAAIILTADIERDQNDKLSDTANDIPQKIAASSKAVKSKTVSIKAASSKVVKSKTVSIKAASSEAVAKEVIDTPKAEKLVTSNTSEDTPSSTKEDNFSSNQNLADAETQNTGFAEKLPFLSSENLIAAQTSKVTSTAMPPPKKFSDYLKFLENAGGILVIIVALTFGFGKIFGYNKVPNTDPIPRINTSAIPNFKISHNDKDTMFITGGINTGFYEELQSVLSKNNNINTIIITSNGGLVTEAAQSARLIEKRRNMMVIARSECDSACILILMAGKHRRATWNMMIGFHAAVIINPLTNNMVTAAEKYTDPITNALHDKGLDERIIDMMHHVSPQLYYVPAALLLATGNLHTLEDVPDPQKNFLSSIPIDERSIIKSRSYIDDFLETHKYSISNPSNPNGKIATAMLNEYMMKLAVFSSALKSADDQSVSNMHKSETDIFDYFVKNKYWVKCQSYMSHDLLIAQTDGEKLLFEKREVALKNLIKSASNNSWFQKYIDKEINKKVELVKSVSSLGEASNLLIAKK